MPGGGLKIWDGVVMGPNEWPAEELARLFELEAFRKPPRGLELPAFGRAWFERIEQQRYAKQGYWLPRSLEVTRHHGETILCLGEGIGTDWAQFACHGSEVIVASPSQEQLGLVQTNFEVRGLPGKFIHAPPTTLPLPSASVDVAVIQGLLSEVEDTRPVIDEVYRLLRPGGKIIIVAQARYNAAFWSRSVFPWQRFFGSGDQRLPGQTARGIRGMMAKFQDHRVSKRHLRRAELPHVWRFFPLPILERLMGACLVGKALKPLSSAHEQRAAA